MISVIVDIIVILFMVLIGGIIFITFYEQLKPVIDKFIPPKTEEQLIQAAKCPNCYAPLKKTKKGVTCENCGFTDNFLETH